MKMKIKRILDRAAGQPPSSSALFLKSQSSGSSRALIALSFLLATALLTWPGAAARASLASAAVDNIITTAAGGGFGSSAPAKEAPISLAIGVARDTLGRGLYFIDDANSNRLLRFLNTSPNPVTLAGTTIQSGHIGLIAGGGTQDVSDGADPKQVYLGGMNGIVVHPSGNAVFFGLPLLNTANVLGVNVSAQTFVFGERTLQPGKLSAITFASLPEMRSLVLGPDGKFYTISTCCGNTSPSPKVFKIISGGDAEAVAGGGTPAEGNGDGGSATQAKLVNPTGIVFDSEGNLLIAEGGSSRNPAAVRKVTTDGFISSLVSDLGFLTGFPVGITINPNGIIYVALGNGQRIIQVSSGGSVTTVAGNGSGFSCDILANPTCGDGGPATQAALNLPGSSSELSYQLVQMAADVNGVFVPDGQRGQSSGYAHIRYINRGANPVTIAGTTIAPLGINSVAGSGKVEPYDGVHAPFAVLNSPHGVAVDALGNLFISDTLNHRMRYVNRGAAAVTIFPGTPSSQTIQPGAIATLNRDVGDPLPDDRILTAFFDSIQGLAVNTKGLFIADAQNGIPFPGGQIPSKKSGLIRFLNTSGSTVTFYPGSPAPIMVPPGQVKVIGGLRPGPGVNPIDIGDGGLATAAVIFGSDLAVDNAGNIYVADYQALRVRKINANTGIITTILGSLNKPTGVAIDATGRVLVADTYNNRVMRENSPGSGTFSVIGDGTLNPPIQRPRDMVSDSGGRIYVVSTGSNRVLELTAPSNSLGTTKAFAGSGAPGYGGDGGPAVDAQFNFPNPSVSEINQPNVSITILKGETGLVFADPGNDRIREVTLVPPVGLATSVSAASYSATALAPDSIVAVFGPSLATGTAFGGTIPLPTNLLGTTIKVRDSGATERLAQLSFVSPGQANYVMPTGTALGPATVTVTSGDGKVSVGTVQIAAVAPGIFTANSLGTGLVAAYVLRVRGAAQIVEQMAVYNPNTTGFDPIPVDLGPPTDLVFLVMYGTGIRYRTGDAGVIIKIGGRVVSTAYSGPAGGFVGLDQLNPNPLPRELIGAGLVNIEVTVDGVAANIGTVSIK